MTIHTADAGIPILTEVISVPGQASRPEGKPASAASPAPVIAVKDVTSEGIPATLNEAQLQRLETEIRERVLLQILERIDFVLEQRVRDSLADVLQTAVEGLACEIRDGLHHSVKDVVTRAVTQEIAKLQAANKSQ
jgi:hypothetical protein